jgi:uncharacterized membrane protein YeaQ/YmgE (transglycosylase-associated protein family)
VKTGGFFFAYKKNSQTYKNKILNRFLQKEKKMDIVSLIIGFISGGVGGNIAGAAMGNKNFGVLGNSIIGLLGGGVGNIVLQLLGIFTGKAAEGSIGTILGNIGSTGVIGAIVLVIASLIKGAMSKPKSP